MSVQWVAVIDANGGLVSLATSDVIASPEGLSDQGYTTLDLPGPPDQDNEVWDSAQRAFVPRQRIDRVEDFIVALGDTYTSLSPAQQAAVRDAVASVLGERRYRHQDEGVSL